MAAFDPIWFLTEHEPDILEEAVLALCQDRSVDEPFATVGHDKDLCLVWAETDTGIAWQAHQSKEIYMYNQQTYDVLVRREWRTNGYSHVRPPVEACLACPRLLVCTLSGVAL